MQAFQNAARPADAENQQAKAQLQAGKGLLAQANSRRALGDIGNLVGGFNQKVNVGKEQAVAEAKAAAAAQNGNAGSWGAKPRNALRPRDATVPAVSAQPAAAAGRSMSQLLQNRSEAAMSEGRPEARSSSAPLPDIDAVDAADPLAATEYVNDIFAYYRRVEPVVRVSPDYMARQGDVNEKMRAILVDWLVDVHLKFKLMPETLFLTTNLIDRFLEAKQVTRKHLQLVGVTAMLVASKYEEIWAPEVRDFVYISDRAYTRDQILNMEKIMLNVLRFNLTVPTPFNFLARFFKAAGCAEDKELTNYATYLVELAQVDYTSLKYPYSMLATSAIYTANRALGRGEAFPYALQRHSGYTEPAVRECAVALANLHRKAPNNSLTAVFKKYSLDKHLAVAKLAAPNALLAEAPLEA